MMGHTTVKVSDEDLGIVAGLLERLIAETPEHERTKKVFHIAENDWSYSLPELVQELKRGSDGGKAYTAVIMDAAKSKGVSLREYCLG